MIAYPSVAARHDPRVARRSLWRHFALGAALSLGAVTLLEIAVPSLVSLFFGAAFSEAVPIARILLIGAFCFSARRWRRTRPHSVPAESGMGRQGRRGSPTRRGSPVAASYV
jgi:hypothetical protein